MSEAALELPIIDLSPLSEGGGGDGGAGEGRDAVVAELAAAAERWGVFFIEGHGIPSSQLRGHLDHMRAFGIW